jgi:hypothetical protein
MIFVIEGIIACGLSLLIFLTLTDRSATARWLAEAEKDLAVSRVKSEYVTTRDVLDKLDFTKLLRSIFSPVILSASFKFLLNHTTV